MSENLTGGPGVRDFWVSPDRNHVVFTGELTSPGNSMLYAVDLESMSGQRQINGLVHPEGSERYLHIGFTSDSRRFLYSSSTDRFSGQMWPVSVPLDATGPSEVRIADDPGIDYSQSLNTWFSPDRERLIIRAIDPEVGDFDYFSFSVDGGESAVKISSAPAGRSSHLRFGPYLTTESDIYYAADFTTAGQSSLYRASFSEPDTQIRIGERAPGGSLFFSLVRVASALDRAVFVTHSGVSGKYEVQSTRLDGTSGQIQISLLPNDVRIGSLELALEGTRALYTTFVDTLFGSPRHIYSASTTTAGTQFRINQTSDRARVLHVVAGGGRVIYEGRSPENVPNLYSASTTMPGAEFRINQAADDVSSLHLLGEGNRAVYVGVPPDGAPTLYAASTLVAGTEVALFESRRPEGTIEHVTPILDGNRVIFYGDVDNDNADELLSMDPDQPGTAIPISGPITPKPSFSSDFLRVTPDESRVVYEGVADGYRPYAGLYSTPVDRQDGEETLIQLVTPDTRIEDYQITPDSDFAIARTRVQLDGVPYRNALFAVPIGGGVPVRLHDEFVAEGHIDSPEIVRDGDQLVYRADSSVYYETRFYCGPNSCPPDPPQGTPTIAVRVGVQDVFAADLPDGPGVLGDMNGDAIVNLDDIRPFTVGLRFPEVFAYSFGLDAVNFGDMNGDGLFDEGDIGGFAAALSVQEALILDELDSLFGDLNGDNTVDAADYAVWREGNGSTLTHTDFYVWRENLGALKLLPGDTNGDGQVDGDDLLAVETNFGAIGPADGSLDGDTFPFDGRVDGYDLIAVQTNLGAASSTAVPESATSCMAFAALSCYWPGRRRC